VTTIVVTDTRRPYHRPLHHGTDLVADRLLAWAAGWESGV
jgi:hypothetical protein